MLEDVYCLGISEVSDNENIYKLYCNNSWKIKGVEISILILILKKFLYNF